MSNHQGFQALATRLINQHGRIVSLRSQAATGTSWQPVLTDSDQPTKAVQTKFDYTERNSGLVQDGDKVFLVDSIIEPTTEMRLVDDIDYSIVAVVSVKPGDQQIMYRVHCRG